jgi:hypothetical protein
MAERQRPDGAQDADLAPKLLPIEFFRVIRLLYVSDALIDDILSPRG